jgi:hypothetical protein
MLYKKIIAVCSEIYTKHTNIQITVHIVIGNYNTVSKTKM